MALLERAKAMLLSPKTEWPVVQAESTDIPALYTGYLIPLAAIPAVAGFIGMSFVGVGGFGYSFKLPVLSGLGMAVVQFVMTLVMAYALAWIANALAPMFGGRPNLLSAFKLVAYGSTAALVGGIFNLLPSLGLLGLLAALYSVYLLYLGLPVLMQCPPDKAVAYTAVLVVCGIAAGLILGALSALFTPGPGGFGAADGGGELSIRTPEGEVRIDTAKMEEAARRMEEASKQAEAASDPAAAGRAMAEAMAAMTGAAGGREPIPHADLKALLPESVDDLARDRIEARGGTAMGIKSSAAEARYRSAEASLELKITDTGSMAGLMGLAGWMHTTGEREDENGSEKVYQEGKRTVREQVRKSGRVEIDLVLANGVIVSAEAQGLEPGRVKDALGRLDLARLEAWPAK